MQITIPDSVPADLHDRFMNFWRGYTQAVGFTATVDDEEGRGDSMFPGGGQFCDNHPDVWDTFSPLLNDDERQEMIQDAAGFFMEAKGLIEGDDEKAGTHFHFTRNGHGAGFWDGDWGDDGDKLTAMSKPYGSLELMGTLAEDDEIESAYLCH